MSTNTPTSPPESAAPAKPPRNPVERMIVWGGIIVMLAVMLVELRAQQGYSRSLEAISNAVDGDKELKLSELKELLAFSPNVSAPVPISGEINDEVQCSWFSLFKSGQYVINLKVSRGEQAEVLTYSTLSAPEESVETPAVAANSSTPSPQSMGGGMGMGGMGMGMGGGGGQRRPNPLRDAIDADADGDLSSTEIADSPNSLAKLDKDSDGQIVAAELTPPPAEGGAGGSRGPAGQGAPPPGATAAAPASGGPPAGGPGGSGGGGFGGGPGGGGGRRFPNRLLEAIDTNADGSISTEERTAAPEGLKKLDADGDGKIVRDELRPPGGFGGGGGPGGGFGPPGGGGGFGPPGGGRGAGERRQRPDAEEPAAPAATGSPPAADTPAPAAEGAAATPAPASPPAAESKTP